MKLYALHANLCELCLVLERCYALANISRQSSDCHLEYATFLRRLINLHRHDIFETNGLRTRFSTNSLLELLDLVSDCDLDWLKDLLSQSLPIYRDDLNLLVLLSHSLLGACEELSGGLIAEEDSLVGF